MVNLLFFDMQRDFGLWIDDLGKELKNDPPGKMFFHETLACKRLEFDP